MTVPIGTILPYGGDVKSAASKLGEKGWLICDGAEYSKVSYSELVEVIGTAFGSSSSSQFNVPDLRGRFVRGLDDGSGRDPDVQSRTYSAPGGYEGNNVGSVQKDAIQAHKHNDNGHKHDHPRRHAWIGGGDKGGGGEYTGVSNSNPELENKGYANLGGPTKVEEKYGEVRYSSETRPQNIYVNWIIKAKEVKG